MADTLFDDPNPAPHDDPNPAPEPVSSSPEPAVSPEPVSGSQPTAPPTAPAGTPEPPQFESISKFLEERGIKPAERGWNDDESALHGLLEADRRARALENETQQLRAQFYHQQQQQLAAQQAAQAQAQREAAAKQQADQHAQFKYYIESIEGLQDADPNQYLRRNPTTQQIELIPGTEQLYEQAKRKQDQAQAQLRRIVQDPKGFYQNITDHARQSIMPEFHNQLQQVLAQRDQQLMQAMQAQQFVNANRQQWINPNNPDELSPEGQMALHLAQEANQMGVPRQNIPAYVNANLSRLRQMQAQQPSQVITPPNGTATATVPRSRISNGVQRNPNRSGTLVSAAGSRPITQNESMNIDALFDQTIKELGGVSEVGAS